MKPINREWVAFYRFVPLNEKLVISELRILPNEPIPSPIIHRDLGSWSGKAESVPAGGITTAVLKKVSLAPTLTRRSLERMRDNIGERVFGLIIAPDPVAELLDQPRRGPGRKPVDPLFLARLAVLYEEVTAQTGGRGPIYREMIRRDKDRGRRLFGTHPPSEKYLAELTRKARDRGYLSGGGQGAAGGVATPLARKTIATAKRPRRKAAGSRGKGR